MEFIKTELEGLLIIEPTVFEDDRGFFMESWSKRTFEAAGLRFDFAQDNHSHSKKKGTLRGIHFQRGEHAQAKLVRCVRGAVLDVAVDLRTSSATFGKWLAVELNEDNKRTLLLPRGFGHAFLTLTDDVDFLYKADGFFEPEAEGSVRWNDPELAINWGIQHPILSSKDANAPLLKYTQIN